MHGSWKKVLIAIEVPQNYCCKTNILNCCFALDENIKGKQMILGH